MARAALGRTGADAIRVSNDRALSILRDEFERGMRVMGETRVEQLPQDHPHERNEGKLLVAPNEILRDAWGMARFGYLLRLMRPRA